MLYLINYVEDIFLSLKLNSQLFPIYILNWQDNAFTCSVVNQALKSLHGGSLEITLTVPFSVQQYLSFYLHEDKCNLKLKNLNLFVIFNIKEKSKLFSGALSMGINLFFQTGSTLKCRIVLSVNLTPHQLYLLYSNPHFCNLMV